MTLLVGIDTGRTRTSTKSSYELWRVRVRKLSYIVFVHAEGVYEYEAEIRGFVVAVVVGKRSKTSFLPTVLACTYP